MSQRGFTLLEALFAAAAVAVGGYFLIDSIVSTGKDYEMTATRLIANQIMEQNVTNLQTVSGLFPSVINNAGRAGFFVICSNRKGEATRDANGNMIQLAVFGVAPGASSGTCAGSEVEAQYAPMAADPKKLQIYILFYSKATGKLISTHQETIQLTRNL